jgi:hypothetical protein
MSNQHDKMAEHICMFWWKYTAALISSFLFCYIMSQICNEFKTVALVTDNSYLILTWFLYNAILRPSIAHSWIDIGLWSSILSHILALNMSLFKRNVLSVQDKHSKLSETHSTTEKSQLGPIPTRQGSTRHGSTRPTLKKYI